MKKLLFTLLLLGSLSISGFSFYYNDSSSFYIYKAIELNKARKVWEADKSFQKALSFDPADIHARIEYGNYLLQQRKYFQAVEQFAKVLEANLNHAVALQKMTEVSFQLRRWEDAVMYGKRLLQNGGASEAKFMVGKSFYELENYGEARKFLQESLAENPLKVETITLLGKVFIELSEYKEAIAVYNQSFQLAPNNSQLAYELGLLYFTMNDEGKAVKFFELAAEKGYKTDLDYFENLGLAYLSQDIEKGVETLSKVLQSKPGNSEILFQIAQAYYKVEKFREAAAIYYKVYQSNNTNSRALYMTGVSYQKMGDKNKGVLLCEQAISMDPALAQLKTQKFVF